MNLLEIYFGPVINSAGGAERVFCNMANELTARGHVVSAVCFEDKIGLPFYQLLQGVNFYNLQNMGERIKVPKWRKLVRESLRLVGGNGFNDPYNNYRYKNAAIRLLKVVKEEKPDIIICYDIKSYQLVHKMQLVGIKLVFMLHMDAEDFLQSISKDQFFALQKADCIQVLLPQYKEILEERLQGNIVVIPNVVPRLISEKKDLCANENVIINIARLEKNKQQYLLIEAFSKIAAKFPKWHLHLYGSDSNRKYVRKLESIIQRYNLENQVKLMGVTNNSISVLQKAKIFAFPSLFEGFGLALAEAMTVGLPCVGLKSCWAVRQLITNDETGILTCDSAEDLAEGLERLMQDEALRARLGSCAKKAMEVYAPEKVWNQWEILLRELEKL